MDHALGRVQAATGCGTVFSGAPGHDRPPGRGPQPGAPGLLRGGPPGALRDFDRRGRAGSARIAQPSRNSEARGARPAGDVGGPRRTFRRRRELGVELPFGNCFEIKPRSPPGSRCSLIGCQNTFLTRRGPAARPAAGTPVPARRTGRRVDSGWWTHGLPPQLVNRGRRHRHRPVAYHGPRLARTCSRPAPMTAATWRCCPALRCPGELLTPGDVVPRARAAAEPVRRATRRRGAPQVVRLDEVRPAVYRVGVVAVERREWPTRRRRTGPLPRLRRPPRQDLPPRGGLPTKSSRSSSSRPGAARRRSRPSSHLPPWVRDPRSRGLPRRPPRESQVRTRRRPGDLLGARGRGPADLREPRTT